MHAILVQGKEHLTQTLQKIDAEIARLQSNRVRVIADIHRQEGGIAALDALAEQNETPPDESDGVDDDDVADD
jgi:hypothetical protein